MILQYIIAGAPICYSDFKEIHCSYLRSFNKPLISFLDGTTYCAMKWEKSELLFG